MRSLDIAGTGMQAQQTNVEVISNNIANMTTTGFKRRRAEFQRDGGAMRRAAGLSFEALLPPLAEPGCPARRPQEPRYRGSGLRIDAKRK